MIPIDIQVSRSKVNVKSQAYANILGKGGISRGETLQVHHDTIRIAICFICVHVLQKSERNILIFGSQILQLKNKYMGYALLYLWNKITMNFFHRKYCEQFLVLNHFFIL